MPQNKKSKELGPVGKKLLESRKNGVGFWLMKTEPNVYSINDLKKDKKALWDGVRNYQARNFMRDEMKVGDQVLIYHSNSDPSAVVGVAEVTKTAQVDPEAFNKKSPYFDPKSQKDNPRWFCVEVKYKKTLKKPISLEELKNQKSLSEMLLIQKGQRLSIQPCTPKEFDTVCKLAEK
jgi:predicted RNA-binding protein with PUA-like domain